MRLTITNSLVIAGSILLGSAIISQFEQAELITSTVLVIISIVVLVLSFQKDRAKLKCALQSKSKRKIILVAVAVLLLFSAMGLAVGRLIYLWSQV